MTWKLAFLTVHPKIIEAYRLFGVFRAAEAAGIVSISVIDLRDFAADQHGSIDAQPYGGGDGMVMRADCLANACEKIFAGWDTRGQVVFPTPSGKLWSHSEAVSMSSQKVPTIFVCGRFAGVDQRFIDTYVTHEYSIGDFVVGGGELPALMFAESSLRLMEGVLGNHSSAANDSFGPGMDGLLEYPLYTRPSEWNTLKVPDVLVSGDHEKIRSWRKHMSHVKTQKLRPDLLKK